MKKSRILLFALVIALFSLFFLSVNFKATTVQTSDLITLEGVSVRTKDPNGIRFVGTVKEGLELEEGSKYGVAIAYGNVEVDEVLLGAEVNGKEVLYATVEQLEEETGYFYVSLVSIPEDSYIQNVTARAFVMDAEGNVTYGSKSLVKNLAQATLELKNKGSEAAETDVAKQVMEYVEKNYMKTYKIGDYVYVNNAVYEYEPTQLAKLFVEDFNKVTGENIESMKNFAFTYKLNPTSSATKEVVASSKLYQFFNANNQEMLAKWGWVLDYIKTVDTNTFSLAQMKLCKTLEADLAAEVSDWYGMQHLLSRFESFFTRAVVANNGLSYQSNLFANPEKYLNLVSFIDSLENKLYTVGSYELVKTNNTIVLPEYDTPNGYVWDGYFAGEEKFEAGEEYVITNTNVVFVPKTHAQEYTIKYFNGEEEFSELAGTYTVNNEVTLPNLDLEDYDFYGWYTSPTFEESTKVTKIAKGSTGNKVYYAKLVAQLYKEVNVTFDPNGGLMRYASTEAAIADFLKDYNAARGKSHTAETFAALGSWAEIGDASTFLYNAKYKAKWAWLVEYIATVASSANKKAYASFLKYNSQSELNSVDSNYIYSIAYELRGWVGQIKYSKNANFVTADYSSESVKASALATAQGETSFVYKDPCTLPTPNKAGYKFVGWKSSLDGKIYTEYPGYKPNPGDITYVAQWEEVKTIVELSKNESQLIDELNPQIFVSSSFDGGKYDINGELYAYGDKVFSSIADALSAAKSGDVIFVFAGTYADALNIDKSNISIYGVDYDLTLKHTDTITVNQSENAIIKGAVSIAASVNNVEIRGFVLENQITLKGNDNISIQNCIINNSIDGSILVPESTTSSNLKLEKLYVNGVAGPRTLYVKGKLTNLIVNECATMDNATNIYDFVRFSVKTEAVAGGTITITNNYIKSIQSGIMDRLPQASKYIIENNYFVNIQAAIYFRSATVANIDYSIKYNTFIKCGDNTNDWDVLAVTTSATTVANVNYNVFIDCLTTAGAKTDYIIKIRTNAGTINCSNNYSNNNFVDSSSKTLLLNATGYSAMDLSEKIYIDSAMDMYTVHTVNGKVYVYGLSSFVEE